MLKFRAFFVAVALAAVSPSVWASPSPAASADQAAPTQAPPPSAPVVQGQPPAPQVPPRAPATVTAGQTVCSQPVPAPSRLPPAGSGPVVYLVVPCFQKQGGYSVIEANTYLYYLQATQHLSSPANNRWVPYDDRTRRPALPSPYPCSDPTIAAGT